MWTVKIAPRPVMGVLDVFLIHKIPDGKLILYSDGHTEKVVYGVESKPSFTIPDEMAPDLVAALHGLGIRPPEQSFCEGKLDAMTEHLKDLRKMLKLS